MARPKVLVADDHSATLETISRILAAKFNVVGKVKDGLEALAAAENIRPDVFVLDISMPRLSGIDVAKKLKEKDPKAKIVFVTVHADADFLGQALDAGGLGYVIKPRLASDLVRAVSDALLGRRFISPTLFESP